MLPTLSWGEYVMIVLLAACIAANSLAAEPGFTGRTYRIGTLSASPGANGSNLETPQLAAPFHADWFCTQSLSKNTQSNDPRMIGASAAVAK